MVDKDSEDVSGGNELKITMAVSHGCQSTHERLKPLHIMQIVLIISALSIFLVYMTSHLTDSNLQEPTSVRHQPVKRGEVGFLMTTKRTTTTEPPGSRDWRVVFNNTGSEACVRTPDIDGDGLPDVLVAVAEFRPHQILTGIETTGRSTGYVVALRGTDGTELWKIQTRSSMFEMMCDIDLNSDGAKDCIVSGRGSTIVAIDLRKGEIIWDADADKYPEYLRRHWNIYQALPLLDLDDDGIIDIVIAHGGNPTIPSNDPNREAGRLMIMSGAAGHPLGAYIEMPDSRETYMSPLMYTTEGDSQYILFGSGGETVSGNLMAISLPNFLEATNPNITMDLPGYYEGQDTLETGEQNIIYIYRGNVSGVMVPPVIIDINRDGVDDLVVSAFDGHLFLMDGETLQITWETSFIGWESYSTPAPGYFDDDEYVDFLSHWNFGTWPNYNLSKAVIVSGKDGSILWEQENMLPVFSSGLVLKSREERLDRFLVDTRGPSTWNTSKSYAEIHGVAPQRNLSQDDVAGDDDLQISDICKFKRATFRKNNYLCEDDVSSLKRAVGLVDRSNTDSTMSFYVADGQKLEYEYTPEPDEDICFPLDEKTGNVNMCTVMTQGCTTTGAVTDVDNDGNLDLILTEISTGRLWDGRYHFHGIIRTTVVSRTDMTDALEQVKNDGSDASQMFAPISSQHWVQYLGSDSSSKYYASNE